ncbi:FeoB-associated Cys-rich membrane protein [Proteiniclasticum sp. BAD-10]|uniref:FeoB-associated Cys-rich membrane protein n=1 Tax=Proteiniclasticum sediminis TaxID=2804028 RepID=A0A941CS80_9CLOT|nr:FeoB-associated Cys-rich membrane protein [Proteiniclasticum sediminis]MBR0576649.1 FeoB-associated Cys-rich membrane protein [Proteiniclasticum sediminis]
MEIAITLLIVGAALYFLFGKIRKTAKGGCNCDSCVTSCPVYDEQKGGQGQKIEFLTKSKP